MARFKPGDKVAIYKPGRAENGASATVKSVMTIEEYGGPTYRGPHAYQPVEGWTRGDGVSWSGPLPDAMVTCDDSNH